jgi:hypothetical protein
MCIRDSFHAVVAVFRQIFLRVFFRLAVLCVSALHFISLVGGVFGCSGHCFAVSFPSLHTDFIITGKAKNPRRFPIITNSLQSGRVKKPEKRLSYAENSEK